MLIGGLGQAPISQLTSLRFFAAVLVFFSHLVFLERSGDPFLTGLYDLVLQQGACGVTFFFLLSGFILTHAYEHALKEGRVSLATYLYRRVVRIFPLHLMVALAFLTYLLLRHELTVVQAVLPNLTLLHSWFADPLVHYSLNGPSWSLSDELFFYALFPLLVKVHRTTLRGIFIAGMLTILAGACIVAQRVDGYSSRVEWLFYVLPVTRLFEFIAGMLLYRAWRAGTGRSWATTGMEVFLVLVVLAIMFSLEWFAIPLVFRYQLAFLLPMAALILVFAHGRGGLSRMLRTPVLQRLGEASFALYLVHRPMITFSERWTGRGAASDAGLALAMLLLAVGASVAVFALLDQPLQRWLRRHDIAKAIASRFAAGKGTLGDGRSVGRL